MTPQYPALSSSHTANNPFLHSSTDRVVEPPDYTKRNHQFIEKGTLYQIRNLLNRTSVLKDPAQCMKATEDFMKLVVYRHIVTAAKSVMTANDRAIASKIVLILIQQKRMKNVTGIWRMMMMKVLMSLK